MVGVKQATFLIAASLALPAALLAAPSWEAVADAAGVDVDLASVKRQSQGWMTATIRQNGAEKVVRAHCPRRALERPDGWMSDTPRDTATALWICRSWGTEEAALAKPTPVVLKISVAGVDTSEAGVERSVTALCGSRNPAPCLEQTPAILTVVQRYWDEPSSRPDVQRFALSETTGGITDWVNVANRLRSKHDPEFLKGNGNVGSPIPSRGFVSECRHTVRTTGSVERGNWTTVSRIVCD